MKTENLFSKPYTDDQKWAMGMFINSVRVFLLATAAFIAGILTVLYALAE